MIKNEMYVRLAPYNPRRGFKVQSYTYRSQKYLGGERPNWYVVDKATADDLGTLSQEHGAFGSPPLFEIYTKEQKEQVEQYENDRYLAALGAIRETISVAKDLQVPQTHDIRSEDVKPKVTVESAGGRGAALPPPRRQTRGKNERGFVAAAEGSDTDTSTDGDTADTE
jgi:hypothetical protein